MVAEPSQLKEAAQDTAEAEVIRLGGVDVVSMTQEALLDELLAA